MDQEVGGSSPPSCTSKINKLSQTIAARQIAMSALCPHSQCRTSSPEDAYGKIQVSSLHVLKRERHSCQKSEMTKNDPVFTA